MLRILVIFFFASLAVKEANAQSLPIESDPFKAFMTDGRKIVETIREIGQEKEGLSSPTRTGTISFSQQADRENIYSPNQ